MSYKKNLDYTFYAITCVQTYVFYIRVCCSGIFNSRHHVYTMTEAFCFKKKKKRKKKPR